MRAEREPAGYSSAGSALLPRWRGPRRAHHRAIYTLRTVAVLAAAAACTVLGRAIGLSEKAVGLCVAFVALGLAVALAVLEVDEISVATAVAAVVLLDEVTGV